MLTINNIHTSPIYKPQSNTLSFCGQKSSLIADVFESQKEKNELSAGERNKAILILLKHADQKFLSPNTITAIVNSLNKKNYPYLETILNLNNDFRDCNISEILDYIKNPSTSTKDVDKKLAIVSGLSEKIKNIGQKRKSEITDLFQRIHVVTCQNLIISDILPDSKNPNSKSLDECINLIYDTLEHKYKKYLEESKKHPNIAHLIKGMARNKILQIIDFNLEGMLITARISDKNLLNDFVFNRLGNFDDIYTPRLKLLNPEDIKLFKEACNNGIKKRQIENSTHDC